MTAPDMDARFVAARHQIMQLGHRTGRRVQVLMAIDLLAAIWYFTWLLTPERIGNRPLYILLVIAEVFNVVQAAGFWWTCAGESVRPAAAAASAQLDVDIFVPVYSEPVEVVEPTIAGAVRLRSARAHVFLLDDGDNPEMEAMAAHYGAGYLQRSVHTGAKAGNINHALAVTNSPFVAVFDCDHVPDPEFLRVTLGHFNDPVVAFVQTPQYYANSVRGGLAAAAWAQQALFFGAIARGKDRLGAMFCCGTNVVFRRSALEAVNGFPEHSLTEDFELSIRLHERGWQSTYVPKILAHGLGPEDMGAYISQQHRWARGCLSALPTVLKARLPFRLRLQYLLSAMFFLSGWSVLVYMLLPVVRILTGAQPLASASADQFLLHFAPYFAVSLLTVSAAGAGVYTFSAFSLTAACFWLHIHATIVTLLGRPGRFVVTPKQGQTGRQPRAVLPTVLAIAILLISAVIGLVRARSPATLNNVAFVALHVCVLTSGVSAAFRRAGGMAGYSALDDKRGRRAA